MDKTPNLKNFLFDNEFIKWRLFRTEESDKYWSEFIKENPQYQSDLELAIRKFKAVRLNNNLLTQQQKDELLDKIIQDSVFKIKRKRHIKYYWSAIACIIVLAISTIFIYTNKPADHIIQNSIVGETLPSKDIRLVSGETVVDIKQNAEIQLSSKGVASIAEEGAEEGTQVTSSLNLTKEEMNKLIVPYGKRSTLKLADGTKIWLNSGTELEFPTNFVNAERHITVKGEIYIEVAEDKSKPFYVHTSQFDVRVFGTKFNVSSYQDSEEQSVVLIDGKVEVASRLRTQILDPGELFAIDPRGVRCMKVDVNEYISWIDGVFILKKTPVSDLLKRVGRYYNVDFKDYHSKLMSRTCTGKLFLSDDIEQVINIICAISNTNYKRIGNSIYISDKTE
ncbi:anti-sigma factor [Bacteroidia bacterium]|nr:anti-sigma factor [Bacteroidia bacterium]